MATEGCSLPSVGRFPQLQASVLKCTVVSLLCRRRGSKGPLLEAEFQGPQGSKRAPFLPLAQEWGAKPREEAGLAGVLGGGGLGKASRGPSASS